MPNNTPEHLQDCTFAKIITQFVVIVNVFKYSLCQKRFPLGSRNQ